MMLDRAEQCAADSSDGSIEDFGGGRRGEGGGGGSGGILADLADGSNAGVSPNL